jgi:peroxiredoxin
MVEVGSRAPDCELTDDAGRLRRLSEFWSRGPAVIDFVRHLGCPFCRREAALLAASAPRFAEAGAEIALITMSTPDEATECRKQFKLPFAVLADPDRACYRAFQVPRGSLLDVSGPKTWLAGFAAVLKHGVALPKQDVKQLSGAFVVDREGDLRFVHLAKHSADLPSHEAMLAVARGLRVAT